MFGSAMQKNQQSRQYGLRHLIPPSAGSDVVNYDPHFCENQTGFREPCSGVQTDLPGLPQHTDLPSSHRFANQPTPSAPFQCGVPVDHTSTVLCTSKLYLPAAQDNPGPVKPHYDQSTKASEEFLRFLAAKGTPARGDRKDMPYTSSHHGGRQAYDKYNYKRWSPADGRRQSSPHGKSKSHGKSWGRSKSRPRSRSRNHSGSCEQSKSRPRSRSRNHSGSCEQSKSRPRSRSRNHSGSCEQSKSRPRSRSRNHSGSHGWSKTHPRSRSRNRSGSHGWSKTHPRSRSRNRSGSWGRSQSLGKSLIRCYIPNAKTGDVPGRRSGSLSGGSSLLNRTTAEVLHKLKEAHESGELQELLLKHRKLIVQKQKGAVEQQDTSLFNETDRFLKVVSKGMESGLFASILREQKEVGKGSCEAQAEGVTLSSSLKEHEEILSTVKQETQTDGTYEFLLPHEKVKQDSYGFSRILGLTEDSLKLQDRRKYFMDVEDEERFLYGEEDVNREESASTRHQVGYVQPQSCSIVQRDATRLNDKTFKNIQSLVKTVGLDKGVSDISKTVIKLHGVGADLHVSCDAAPTMTVSGLDMQGCTDNSGVVFLNDNSLGHSTTSCSISSVFKNQLPATDHLLPAFVVSHDDLPTQGSASLDRLAKPVTTPTTASKVTTGDCYTSCSFHSQHPESLLDEGHKQKTKIVKEMLQTMEQTECRKGYHVMELKRLLKQQESEFMIPVVGFYCQLCEEFFGDLSHARDHAECHQRNEKSKKHFTLPNEHWRNQSCQANPAVILTDGALQRHSVLKQEENVDKKAEALRMGKVLNSSSAEASPTWTGWEGRDISTTPNSNPALEKKSFSKSEEKKAKICVGGTSAGSVRTENSGSEKKRKKKKKKEKKVKKKKKKAKKRS